MNPYIYTFIRDDLPYEQKIVQLGHATWEAGLVFEKPQKTASLVLLHAKNEDDLLNIAAQLENKGIEYVMFFETEINECTAICTKPIISKERNFFKKFNLYKESNSCKS